MSAPSPKSVDVGLVSFNGLRVKKSTVTNLVDSLVKADPLKAPSGENLSDNRRRDIGLLLEGRLDRESSLRLLSTLEADEVALRYLTGLMASRA
jgi:DNA-binding MarR family transcriptional regulator